MTPAMPVAAPRRVYVAFDDTDYLGAERGTGKVGRWFCDELVVPWRPWAVVRQQLLVDSRVPYTSHNSAAVCVLEYVGAEVGGGDGSAVPPGLDDLVERAVRHLARHWLDGSDPGLCVAWDGSPALERLAAFGRRAATEVVTQAEAYAAAEGVHLSGHGGSEDGVIGAAAGVGLTHDGWSGRMIDYHVPLREFGDPVTVAELAAAGIAVAALDRDAPVPRDDEPIATQRWLRPRLWGGRPVVPVQRDGNGGWVAVGPRTAASEK